MHHNSAVILALAFYSGAKTATVFFTSLQNTAQQQNPYGIN